MSSRSKDKSKLLPYNTRPSPHRDPSKTIVPRDQPQGTYKIAEVDKSRPPPSDGRYGYGGVWLGKDTPEYSALPTRNVGQPASDFPSTTRPTTFSSIDLKGLRLKEKVPDNTFDLDGDGSIGARDFYIGTQFDTNKNLHLDPDEVEAMKKATYFNSNGVFTMETKPVKTRSNENVLRTDGRPRTKSELVKMRSAEFIKAGEELAMRTNNNYHAGVEKFEASLPTRYPFALPSKVEDWGDDSNLDKISTKYTQAAHTTNLPRPKQDTGSHLLSSNVIGQRASDGIPLEEWNVRRTKHLGTISDVNERILSKTEYLPRRPSFQSTYARTIGGSHMVKNALTEGDHRWASTNTKTNEVVFPNFSSSVTEEERRAKRQAPTTPKISNSAFALENGDPKVKLQRNKP